jgi:hypothetical protein
MGKFWKVASLDNNEETPKMVFEEYENDDNNPTGRSMTFIKNIRENTLTVTQNPDELVKYMDGLRYVDYLDSSNPAEVARFMDKTGYIFKTHNLEAKTIDRIIHSFYWGTPNPNGRQWFRSIENNLFDKTIVNFFANPRNFNMNDPSNLSPKMGGRKYNKSKKSRKSKKSKRSKSSRK